MVNAYHSLHSSCRKIVTAASPFSNMIGDKSSQLLAAKNFLEGNGLTIKKVLLNDLSSEVFTPLGGMAPGYSVVVASLLRWLFNGDYKTAALVFDLIAGITIFLVFTGAAVELLVFAKMAQKPDDPICQFFHLPH